jgi:hypothetical protein
MHIREFNSLRVADIAGFTHDATGNLPVGVLLEAVRTPRHLREGDSFPVATAALEGIS